MSEATEPMRWRDDPGELPEVLLHELEAYASDGPTADELLAIRAALPAGARAASAGPTTTPRVLLVSALVALNAALGALWWRPVERPQSRAPQTRPAAPLATQEMSLPRPQSEPQTSAQAAEPAVHAAEPVLTPPVARPARGRARARLALAPPATPADPAGELALLRGARRALAAAPARALELTAEHEQTYPHGMFEQERELLRIEALSRIGEQRAVRERARVFEASFPDSTHLERIRVLLDAP